MEKAELECVNWCIRLQIATESAYKLVLQFFLFHVAYGTSYLHGRQSHILYSRTWLFSKLGRIPYEYYTNHRSMNSYSEEGAPVPVCYHYVSIQWMPSPPSFVRLLSWLMSVWYFTQSTCSVCWLQESKSLDVLCFPPGDNYRIQMHNQSDSVHAQPVSRTLIVSRGHSLIVRALYLLFLPLPPSHLLPLLLPLL